MDGTVAQSYSDYQMRLDDAYEPSLKYMGESMATHMASFFKEGVCNYVLWEHGDTLECCRVDVDRSALSIGAVYVIPNPFTTMDKVKEAFAENNVAWINLCHFRYDRYYDKFPAYNCEDGQALSVGELKTAILGFIKEHLHFKEGSVVVLGSSLARNIMLCSFLSEMNLSVVSSEGEDVAENSVEIKQPNPIKLYSVGPDSVMVVDMPDKTDMMVFEDTGKFQVRYSFCDMLGNRWLFSKNPGGGEVSKLIVKNDNLLSEL